MRSSNRPLAYLALLGATLLPGCGSKAGAEPTGVPREGVLWQKAGESETAEPPSGVPREGVLWQRTGKKISSPGDR